MPKAKTPRSSLECGACDVTKTKRTAMDSKELKRFQCDRLNSDVKKLRKSIRGCEHFTVWEHEGSEMKFVKLAKRKTEMADQSKQVINTIERETEIKTSHFRPDGGGEYSSDDLKDWLKERGIKYDPSTARVRRSRTALVNVQFKR